MRYDVQRNYLLFLKFETINCELVSKYTYLGFGVGWAPLIRNSYSELSRNEDVLSRTTRFWIGGSTDDKPGEYMFNYNTNTSGNNFNFHSG